MNYSLVTVGNPNSGKTSLFNALTGARQQVGNWSGVTVDKKMGEFSAKGQDYTLMDLPGIYSLANQEASLDEQNRQPLRAGPAAGPAAQRHRRRQSGALPLISPCNCGSWACPWWWYSTRWICCKSAASP